MNSESFGKRLNKVRKEQHLTSEKLSEKCAINAVYIRQIESASRIPSLPVFVDICNALHISPNYLLDDSLETNEQEQFDSLWKRIRSLTPKQVSLVTAMIETMVDKLEEWQLLTKHKETGMEEIHTGLLLYKIIFSFDTIRQHFRFIYCKLWEYNQKQTDYK